MPASRSSRKRSFSSPASARSHSLRSRERVWTDVILTIKPEFAVLIRNQEKNHEFRSYKLRPDVKHLWLYESSPTCAIKYVFKPYAWPNEVPGQLRDPTGVGNDAFDAGDMSRYAYPVRSLYKLQAPLKRDELQAKYKIRSPQGFCYASRQMVEELTLHEMEKIY